MATVSVVVPVYNNAASLSELMARFQELAARQADHRFEFIFVDDGSEDASWEALEEIIGREPRACLVKLSRNFGSAAAVAAGLEQAAGDAVVAIAADLQDPPELIDRMLEHWEQGRKVVLAARSSRDDPWPTRLLADGFYWLFRRFAMPTMPRHGFDFFLVDRQVRDLLVGIQESNAYLMGLILWLGFSPEVLYYHRRRRDKRFGRSMWTLVKRLKYFVDAFVGFSYAPLRAASAAGIGCCLLGFAYAAAVVFRRLWLGAEIQGWASLMVVILLVSGVQMTMIGVLGEYLCRNLDQTRRRPLFVRDHVRQGAEVKARRERSQPQAATGDEERNVQDRQPKPLAA